MNTFVPGNFYHFFNHANGDENLFLEDDNYSYFLLKLRQHILPVCRLFAYCLMPNHFHLFGGIRPAEELVPYYSDFGKRIIEPTSFADPTVENQFSSWISKSFSNLFNSYSQSFNRLYDRKGSLFIPNMKSEEVRSSNSFCRVVHYVHANPVHHGFVKKMEDWKYSSYNAYLTRRRSSIERNFVIDTFGGFESFLEYHKQPIDRKIKWLE